MKVPASPKLMKRLSAAEGYLDLDLPERALIELDAVKDPGPWEATVEYMKGEAFIAARRFEEAIAPLKKAAQLIPAPHNKGVWQSLSECYRSRGDDEMAELTEMFAENPQAEVAPNVIQVLQITLMLEQMVDHDEDDEESAFWDEEDADWHDEE